MTGWVFAAVLIVLAVLAVRQMHREDVFPTRARVRVWWNNQVAGWDDHFGDVMPKWFRRPEPDIKVTLMAYQGKAGCRSMYCRQIIQGDYPGTCYGWHCANCDGPTSQYGHQHGCPEDNAREGRNEKTK